MKSGKVAELESIQHCSKIGQIPPLLIYMSRSQIHQTQVAPIAVHPDCPSR
ncbi:MAG: hypothetical protein Q9169_003018 [Polycauliona sp. 2 TL-2023]